MEPGLGGRRFSGLITHGKDGERQNHAARWNMLLRAVPAASPCAWSVYYEPKARPGHFSGRPRFGLGFAISISPGLVPRTRAPLRAGGPASNCL